MLLNGNEPEGSLINEPIEPEPGTFDTRWMARGQPGVPGRFKWRGKNYTVARVIKTWRTLGPCTSGADETYVRGHFYRVLTTTGETMVLHCTRYWTPGREKKKGRWKLYAVETPEN